MTRRRSGSPCTSWSLHNVAHPPGGGGGRVRRCREKGGTGGRGRYRRTVAAIAAREETLCDLPDGALPGLAGGARDGAAICAIGREAARRTLGERPYDVQLLGTLV